MEGGHKTDKIPAQVPGDIGVCIEEGKDVSFSVVKPDAGAKPVAVVVKTEPAFIALGAVVGPFWLESRACKAPREGLELRFLF